jgi:predicted phosphodiesterase
VCGHIHEAVGAQTLRRCLCYNTGSLGEPYGKLQVGFLEIDAKAGSVTLTHCELETDQRWEAVGGVERAKRK